MGLFYEELSWPTNSFGTIHKRFRQDDLGGLFRFKRFENSGRVVVYTRRRTWKSFKRELRFLWRQLWD